MLFSVSVTHVIPFHKDTKMNSNPATCCVIEAINITNQQKQKMNLMKAGIHIYTSMHTFLRSAIG